jgi:hypothetical protein
LTALAPALFLASTLTSTVRDYVERYLETFPSRATEAGRSDLDDKLEDLGRDRRAAWLAFNKTTRERLQAFAPETLDFEGRLDKEALLAQIEREIHALAVLKRPERDPLYWTPIVANATVFLLIRDDVPVRDRIARARPRLRLLPRLAAQARDALLDSTLIAPELCEIAARQIRASALFYHDAFPALAETEAVEVAAAVRTESRATSKALASFATFLEDLAKRASGSARLGKDYAETFRLGTGTAEPVDAVLARAETDVGVRRAEAAAFGREAWPALFGAEKPPGDDRALLGRLFARVGEDRAADVDAFVLDYRTLVAKLEAFVRDKKIATLPDPLTLVTDRSPAFFVGQSVGGVYPAGPYAPAAKTLWYLPTPPDDAKPEEKAAFFRDFNHHFNVMITPHEIMPGHYFQAKVAAKNPHVVRVLFPDGVYVEGWGTFCERLMLDAGWGEPLDRLAHLKKRLENAARVVVDIRVHTKNASRDDVLRYAKEEALQDEQFAANLWTRALTSAPQLTTYYLGEQQVSALRDELQDTKGDAFVVREFVDGMVSLGPVPVRAYRERLLARPSR